jgi:PII-like signaling protein
LKKVEPVFADGVITLERAHVLVYRPSSVRHSTAWRRQIVDPAAASAAFGVRTMREAKNGVLLRIFTGDSDKEPGGRRPLYEAIVRRARDMHMAGATVLRGPMGFGRHSRMHTAKLLELSSDLPVVIEIVDAEEGRHVSSRGRRAGHRGRSRSKRCASCVTSHAMATVPLLPCLL